MTKFDKPAITPQQQLELLEQRGLIVHDHHRALSFLNAVSFFRLSPYMRPFQRNSDHLFKAGTGFRHLVRLYDFDRRLRLLIMDAVERAEVAVRASLTNHMGPKHGTHWYLAEEHFKDKSQYHHLRTEIERKQEQAVRDYNRECRRIEELKEASEERKIGLKEQRQRESYARHYALVYTEPELMPNWAMAEEITLGTLSHLYKALGRDNDKKKIARSLGLEAPLLESWLHTLTAVRNICAHHSRLWNRELGIKPAVPRSQRILWPKYLAVGYGMLHTRVSVVLPILQHFMHQCAPHASWRQRLFSLFDEFPDIPLQAMGLPQDWQQDSFWQQPEHY